MAGPRFISDEEVFPSGKTAAIKTVPRPMEAWEKNKSVDPPEDWTPPEPKREITGKGFVSDAEVWPELKPSPKFIGEYDQGDFEAHKARTGISTDEVNEISNYARMATEGKLSQEEALETAIKGNMKRGGGSYEEARDRAYLVFGYAHKNFRRASEKERVREAVRKGFTHRDIEADEDVLSEVMAEKEKFQEQERKRRFEEELQRQQGIVGEEIYEQEKDRSSLRRALLGGAEDAEHSGITGILGILSVTGDEEYAEAGQAVQTVIEGGKAQAAKKLDVGMLERNIRSAARSATQVFATGGTTVGSIATFAASEFGDSILTGRAAGLEGRDLLLFAGRAAAIEGGITAGFSAAGGGGMESYISNMMWGSAKQMPKQGFKSLAKSFVKTLVEVNGPETIEELAVEHGHLLNTYLTTNDKGERVDPEAMDPEAYWNRMLDVVVTTNISGGVPVAARYTPAAIKAAVNSKAGKALRAKFEAKFKANLEATAEQVQMFQAMSEGGEVDIDEAAIDNILDEETPQSPSEAVVEQEVTEDAEQEIVETEAAEEAVGVTEEVGDDVEQVELGMETEEGPGTPPEMTQQEEQGVTEADRAIAETESVIQEEKATKEQQAEVRTQQVADIQEALGVTETQADAIQQISEAMGLETRTIGFEEGDKPTRGAAKQGVNRGEVQFYEDGRAMVRGFEHANVATGLHETGHIARRRLLDKNVPQDQRAGITDEDIDVVENEFSVKESKWTREQEEQYARAWERYVRGFKAPSVEVQGVFDKISSWMKKIYKKVSGSDIDVKISDNMRKVFDKLVKRKQHGFTGDVTSNLVTKEGSQVDVLYQTSETKKAVKELKKLQKEQGQTAQEARRELASQVDQYIQDPGVRAKLHKKIGKIQNEQQGLKFVEEMWQAGKQDLAAVEKSEALKKKMKDVARRAGERIGKHKMQKWQQYLQKIITETMPKGVSIEKDFLRRMGARVDMTPKQLKNFLTKVDQKLLENVLKSQEKKAQTEIKRQEAKAKKEAKRLEKTARGAEQRKAKRELEAEKKALEKELASDLKKAIKETLPAGRREKMMSRLTNAKTPAQVRKFIEDLYYEVSKIDRELALKLRVGKDSRFAEVLREAKGYTAHRISGELTRLRKALRSNPTRSKLAKDVDFILQKMKKEGDVFDGDAYVDSELGDAVAHLEEISKFISEQSESRLAQFPTDVMEGVIQAVEAVAIQESRKEQIRVGSKLLQATELSEYGVKQLQKTRKELKGGPVDATKRGLLKKIIMRGKEFIVDDPRSIETILASLFGVDQRTKITVKGDAAIVESGLINQALIEDAVDAEEAVSRILDNANDVLRTSYKKAGLKKVSEKSVKKFDSEKETVRIGDRNYTFERSEWYDIYAMTMDKGNREAAMDPDRRLRYHYAPTDTYITIDETALADIERGVSREVKTVANGMLGHINDNQRQSDRNVEYRDQKGRDYISREMQDETYWPRKVSPVSLSPRAGDVGQGMNSRSDARKQNNFIERFKGGDRTLAIQNGRSHFMSHLSFEANALHKQQFLDNANMLFTQSNLGLDLVSELKRRHGDADFVIKEILDYANEVAGRTKKGKLDAVHKTLSDIVKLSHLGKLGLRLTTTLYQVASAHTATAYVKRRHILKGLLAGRKKRRQMIEVLMQIPEFKHRWTKAGAHQMISPGMDTPGVGQESPSLLMANVWMADKVTIAKIAAGVEAEAKAEHGIDATTEQGRKYIQEKMRRVILRRTQPGSSMTERSRAAAKASHSIPYKMLTMFSSMRAKLRNGVDIAVLEYSQSDRGVKAKAQLASMLSKYTVANAAIITGMAYAAGLSWRAIGAALAMGMGEDPPDWEDLALEGQEQKTAEKFITTLVGGPIPGPGMGDVATSTYYNVKGKVSGYESGGDIVSGGYRDVRDFGLAVHDAFTEKSAEKKDKAVKRAIMKFLDAASVAGIPTAAIGSQYRQAEKGYEGYSKLWQNLAKNVGSKDILSMRRKLMRERDPEKQEKLKEEIKKFEEKFKALKKKYTLEEAIEILKAKHDADLAAGKKPTRFGTQRGKLVRAYRTLGK